MVIPNPLPYAFIEPLCRQSLVNASLSLRSVSGIESGIGTYNSPYLLSMMYGERI
jgi:hypothetical protein